MDAETKEIVAKAELPKVMKAIRAAVGLSQQEMASLSGISRQMISYYETADAVPTVGTLDKWLDAIVREIRRIRRQAKHKSGKRLKDDLSVSKEVNDDRCN